MLEITKRKMVTTRKEHECFGCAEVINKGEDAVSVMAKEDDRHARFHLHLACNQLIVKHKVDVHTGCINTLNHAIKRRVDFENQLSTISEFSGIETKVVEERVLEVARTTVMSKSEVAGEISREAKGG